MSIRTFTPCDDGVCPYDAQYNCDCEYWCGAEEPQDIPEEWDDDEIEDDEEDYYEYSDTIYDLDCGFDPYMGCYSDDC